MYFKHVDPKTLLVVIKTIGVRTRRGSKGATPPTMSTQIDVFQAISTEVFGQFLDQGGICVLHN